MRWTTILVVATLALSGCNSSQYSAPDPFAWGNRRVPAPSTGSLGRTEAPYFSAPQGNTGTLNLGPPPSGAVPQLQTPPAGGVHHGVPATTWRSQAATDPLFTNPAAFRSPTLAGGSPTPAVPVGAAGAVVGSGLASAPRTGAPSGVTYTQPAGPAPSSPVFASDRSPTAAGSTAVRTAGGTQLNPMHVNDGTNLTPPRPFVPAPNAIDISTLPPAPAAMNGTTYPPMGAYPIYGNQTVVPAGGFAPPQTVGAAQANSARAITAAGGSVAAAGWTAHTSSSPPQAGSPGSTAKSAIAGQMGGYGYSEDYSSLKGRIEYSATARQWKLRYIPRDASEHKIDNFGGSVILANNDLLQGYSTGEFVRVEGRLTGHEGAAHSFAPSYQVVRIARQTQ